MATTTKEAAVAGTRRRIGTMLTICGALILLAGVLLSGRELWFQLRAVKTTGIYTDSNGATDVKTGKLTILYVMEFTGPGGKKYQFAEQVPGEPLPDHTPITVFYDPANPADARMLTSGRWELAIQFLIAGLGISACAALLRALGRKAKLSNSDPAVAAA